MTVFEALATRRSIRGFRPDPVPRASIETILRAAARAPSGSNIQPWQVRVTQGTERARLCAAVHAATPVPREYEYYPRSWREPYQARRRKVGWDLYALAGIARGDKAGGEAQRARNFDFFGAPVGLFVHMDRDLEAGSMLDCGIFLGAIMLAARGLGLDTCPQAAWCDYHDVVRDVLGIAPNQLLLCGMALGFCDPAEPTNQLATERAALDAFCTFGPEA